MIRQSYDGKANNKVSKRFCLETLLPDTRAAEVYPWFACKAMTDLDTMYKCEVKREPYREGSLCAMVKEVTDQTRHLQHQSSSAAAHQMAAQHG